jgi:hypothetical protein
VQLKRKRCRDLRGTLLASSCALLATAGAKAESGDWSFDSGLLYYSETDRVKATEPTLIAERDLGDGDSLSARFVVDALTGATPTGAMPASQGSSLTGASGSVSANAGEFPLAQFRDQRCAVSATWSQRLAQQWRMDIGANYSTEQDFRSQGANALLARDFNRHNTTLSLGVSYESDNVLPHGGVQMPLGMVGSGGTLIANESSKTVEGALAGITQVLTQSWIAELNYSYSKYHGYLNDPYKVVSILNTHLGGLFPRPLPIFGPPIGEPVQALYENRPDARAEKAVYLGNKASLAGDVVDFSYRYGWDNWGIHSQTYELRYRWPFGDGYYLQPHLRYYDQTAADFYQRSLLDSDPLPQYVSADYRLANIIGRTFGLECGTTMQGSHLLRIRLEYYLQSGTVDPRVLVGVQQDFNSFPDLAAYIAQVSYSF